MPTDPTLASKGPETVRSQSGHNAAEDAQLDDAIQRADDLLVQSLRVEERQRKRRTLRKLLVPLGTLIMLAAIYKIALLAGVIGSQAALPAAAATSPAKSVEKNEAKAQTLAGEGWALWQKRQLPEAEAK